VTCFFRGFLTGKRNFQALLNCVFFARRRAAFKYPKTPLNNMNAINALFSPGSAGKRAFLLVALMLCSSMAPMMALPGVSAHDSINDTVWPKTGSNDTGWVQLDATGADPLTGAQATADWTLEFAPGADLSNVSFQVRVDGGDGLKIEEPMLVASDIGINLLDWRGLGDFGAADSFEGTNPHNGRLSPNSDSGATWTLPSDAEITELVIEALAPVDPAVSFEPIDLEIEAYTIHPTDGRMYMAILDDVLVLDYNNAPTIIDMIEFESDVIDMEIDIANNLIHFLTQDEGFMAMSLTDSTIQKVLPDNTETAFVDLDQFAIASTGDVYAANEEGLYLWNGGSWVITGDAFLCCNSVNAMLEVNGVLYTSTDGGGVARFDLTLGQSLSTWSTANSLHSDEVHRMMVSGTQLLLASPDAGLARYDWSSGFWLSTWNSGNWLASNDVAGLATSGNALFILNGDSLHTYNTASNLFSGSQTLASFGMTNDGQLLMMWPNAGARSPSTDTILVSDGDGALVELTPGSSPLNTGVLLLGSGPTSGQMVDSTELNGVLFVATDDQYLNRFDTQSARWIEPVFIGADINGLSNDGIHVYIAAENGAHQMHNNGTVLQTWDTSNTPMSGNEITLVQSDGSTAVLLNQFYGEFAAVNLSGSQPLVFESLTLSTGSITDAAIHNEVAYVGTQNDGLLRYNIANDTWLTPWISTGINGANEVPVAVIGDILYFGIPGYGVARKDLSTGELMIPLTAAGNTPGTGTGTSSLPSDNIYALESDGFNLYIGTQQGARQWDGTQMTALGQGSSWNERPQQFYDFVAISSISGGSLYAGTNIGVCKYSIATLGINDCLNVYDGMPNWATYSIGAGYSNTYLFGGTNSGVGIITTSPFEVVGEWTAGEQTNNAPVTVVGDVAFIALDGIGIARYDLTSNEWLTLWTDDNYLDDGNEDATALSVDINPNYIWVGGSDGFQLLNATDGSEVYDIEKSSSLFAGNGDPLDMILKGNVMYYHDGASSDNLYRFDALNFTSITPLDAGAQIGQNNGDVNGMNIVDDIIMISVASQNWWQVDGSGGIAQWNTSSNSWDDNILPIGQVDRVTAYESSTGNMWVSWGENSLQYMAANGTMLGEWDDGDFNFPIREIIEYDGEVLFATEDGVARYDESAGQWLSEWTPGSGLPSDAGDQIYELWTDGTDLVVGSGEVSQFGQFRNGAISHWDGATWNNYETGANGLPNGYPITMAECAGILHIGIYANNGGVARFDMTNDSFLGTFTRSDWNENYGEVSGVACDTSDTLYVAFYEDGADIKKYSYGSSSWLNPITTANHNLPSDRVWWDAIDYSNSMLVLGHGIGTSGDNIIGGGYSAVATSGGSTAQVNFNGQGSSVTSFQWLTNEWLIGQAGGSSGYSHVDTISSLGQNTLLDFPGLVSGQVTTMVGNSTHLWVSTQGSSQGFGQGSAGAGLLQGERLADGSIDWQQGWTMVANSVAKDMELIGTDLYITTTPTGLYKLDTTTGALNRIAGGLHNNMDGLFVDGNTLVIGLQGSSGSAAGVQLYNLTTGFGNGKLLGGLPSNIINAFTESSTMLYIATNGGIGRWDFTASDWINPLTTSDGLPTNVIEDVQYVGTDLWIATTAGVVKMDTLTNATTLYSSGSGLMATSAQSLATATNSGVTTLFIGHDGAGSERPGVTSIETSSSAVEWHKFDQLSSNTVDALAADWWGLHIATDIGPMTHYNGQSNQFEDGVPSFQVAGWPIQKMVSDGEHILTIGENGASILSARTQTHATLKMFLGIGMTGGTITPDAIWLTTGEDGLFGYENNAQYTELDRFSLRKASPMNVGFNSKFLDISDMTHPGMPIVLANLTNTAILDSTLGVVGTNGIMFQTVPLAFTSPVNNAATWAKSVSLKYNATIELNNNPDFETTMQLAVDNGIIINGTQFVQLTLRSPSNGSMHVRLIYDYVKTETPIALAELVDRPDDGGGALLADWSLVHDDDFARYLIYVNEGPVWNLDGPVTATSLSSRTVDKAVSLHSRLSSEVTTANGQPLIDGTDYYAVVVVEYDDGRLGMPSPVRGPASPSDEVPLPPIWANAGPHEGGEDGDLDVEWARCTSLDLKQTNIYASTQPMTDVLGFTPNAEVMRMEGNSTVLSLTPGQPYWLGLTCVDDAGQEDLMNALIVGPFVPTGGLNDNTAPPKMENVAAIDTPDDDGGRITVSWDINSAEDCTFYAIFMRTWDDAEDAGLPTGVADGFTQAKIINDCAVNSTIVTSIDGMALQDGQMYYVGVVAYDDWLNANLDDVELISVTPLRNQNGQPTAPDRTEFIQAFDHPDDDGTSIDVLWSISDADDFSHYTVWAADQPLADLSVAWALFGEDPARCGCLKVNKQWIDESFSPLEVTLTTALYGGTGNLIDITSATPQAIQPDVELYVVVTVHDLGGNVYLTDLTQATVTPIDNDLDVDAPMRLQSLELSDRPSDDGSALLLDFELSGASDVGSYEVYAATWSFTSVGPGTLGPSTPIATLDRSPELPLTIDLVAGDTPVIPGQEIWAVVVARDTSGNAFTTDLISTSAQSVDDGVDPNGDYLPNVGGVSLTWVDESNILVTWTLSNDDSIVGYSVYIAEEEYSSTMEATRVVEVGASNSFLITSDAFADLTNASAWYVGVTVKDDLYEKQAISPVKLGAYEAGAASGDDGQEANEGTDFSSLLTTPNLLAAGLFLTAIILFIAVVRTRGNQRGRSKSWELQEATWGIQDEQGWGDAPASPPPASAPAAAASVPAPDMYAPPAGQQDIYGRPAYQPAQPVMQPVQNNDLLNDLGVGSAAKQQNQSIDTSFLDDLL
jgi:hypothetical protein